ncbi:hypothetical protein NDU88_010752 [Pleurodeles waltl]|uniref:Uncharacterized protein n=1 Tax=Pleurodeles waltl TaxID=8319 RepID=A0AAV7S229_PLEWA|nr:hypothetical protein NDU88_010752 [Pleurodeles waltl]
MWRGREERKSKRGQGMLRDVPPGPSRNCFVKNHCCDLGGPRGAAEELEASGAPNSGSAGSPVAAMALPA